MSDRMLFTVVEPHSDDAMLSLHEHMTLWRAHGHAVRIVTVFGSNRRATEGAVYAHRIGAGYRWLGLPESGVGIASGARASEEGVSAVRSAFLADGLEGLILGPLGLRHPEHLAVVGALLAEHPNYLRYIEQPYAMKYVNQDDLDGRAAGLPVKSLRLSTKAKWDLFPEVYRSQSLFWRNEGPLCRGSRAWEVVLGE
jgi:hypothetical protein